jgi:peptide deformylase
VEDRPFVALGNNFMPTLLQFVPKSDPLLREVIPPVEDFNDPALHELIENMCYSILPTQLKAAKGAHESAAGMAANQWGMKKRVFLFTPNGTTDTDTNIEVMINPSYKAILRPGETEVKIVPSFEGCFSVPLTTGLVNRFDAIQATYYTPAGEKIERVLEGWEARVFQHETDHLDGKLFDGALDKFSGPDCVERIVFNNKDEMMEFWEKGVKPLRKNNFGEKQE